MEYLVNPSTPEMLVDCTIWYCGVQSCDVQCSDYTNHCPNDQGHDPCTTYDCGGYEYKL